MERIVEVVPEAGLHARPASKLVQTANRFGAEVSVGRAEADDEGLVSAASMLSVTGLNVEHGESVRVVAEGADAAEALEAVRELLTTPVEDAEGDGGGEGGEDGDRGDDGEVGGGPV